MHIHCRILAPLLALAIILPLATAAAPAPPSVKGFQDSGGHWYSFTRGFIRPVPGQKENRYAPGQYREICENIILFQRDNGGWPKDYDMRAKLTPEQRDKVIATRNAKDTSYDNHNIHSQIVYLAKVYTITNDKRHAGSCLRGLDYVFKSQLRSGGWPSWWPGGGDSFKGHFTFNDGVTIGCMQLLRDAANGINGFAWLDDATRRRAREAMAQGVRGLLATQYITKAGVLTAWGQQHYPDTLKPAPARPFELACLTPQDTSEIVDFLMEIKTPGEEIMRSIVAATEWLRKTRLTDYHLDKREAPPEKYYKSENARTTDLHVLREPNSKPIWAREYDMEKHVPIFAGEDAVPKYDFNELSRMERNRTPWFGNYGDKILKTRYPDWLEKNPAAQKYIAEYRGK